MPTELCWLSSVPASALYAASQMLRGRKPVDAELAEALGRPVRDLSAAIEAAAVPTEPFLGHLSGLAAVLNGNRELPEVLRLGWLLSQLNLDLPKYQGQLTSARTLQVGALALVPAVLAAAEEVELARLGEPLIAQAIAAWDTGEADAGLLVQWW